MRQLFAALAIATALPAFAQSWGNIDLLLTSQLTGGQPLTSASFMPDSADPATARVALAVAYTHVPGSAGTTSIHTALFRNTGGVWVLQRKLEGLFGLSPENPVFGDGKVDVTTTTLGPNDARCCPSVKARWSVNLATGVVTRLN